MKTLNKLISIAFILAGMLLFTACSSAGHTTGYTVYEGYNYPNYGYYYGRGLYNRPTGFGGGGPIVAPSARPNSPVNKAE